MPKIPLARAPLGARRGAILPPLIPLQEPSNPLIPLQIPAPHARLQHELSHQTSRSPDQTSIFSPKPTAFSGNQLRRRQNVVTTVTDADVVVVDSSGHTVATTILQAVPTGSLAITLPFTTVTVPPIASITGVVSLPSASIPTAIPAAATSIIPGIRPPGETSVFVPFPTSSSSSSSSSSLISVQIPSPSTQQILSSPLPTPGIPSPATSNTGNNNLGLPTTSATTLSSSSAFGIPISPEITTSVSSNIVPTTSSSSSITGITISSPTIIPTAFATLVSSSSLNDISSRPSSGTSTRSASSTSHFPSTSTTHPSTTGLTAGSTGANGGGSSNPSVTGAPPSATTTAAAAASSNGSTVNVPVVGGVVGGLAGLAVVLVLVLLLIKWWRRRKSDSLALRSIDDESYVPGTSNSNAPMTQHNAAFGAGAAGTAGGAGIGAVFKRMTGGSTATTETSPSERGFQNFGGRKLESVLVSGGDGYGGPARSGAHTPTSFSRGWAESFPYDPPSKHSSMVVGPATPFRRPSGSISTVAELAGSSIGRPDSDTVKMMPSPARAATYTTPERSTNQPMTQVTGLSPPFRGPRPLMDQLGRSRYSQDGSRGSKFTEDF